MAKTIHELLTEIGNHIVKEMKNKVSVDTGKLKNSLDYEIHKNELYITMEHYGIYVDEGTKPHMPPVNKIKKWARRRNLNEWAVAMNIKKYGTKKHPYMDKLEDFSRNYERNLELGIYDYLEDYIYNEVENNKRKYIKTSSIMMFL